MHKEAKKMNKPKATVMCNLIKSLTPDDLNGITSQEGENT